MKLSIVITTRNRYNDLILCIDSIKKSIMPSKKWELIIIDDNSDDETKKLKPGTLKLQHAHIKIIHNDKQLMMVRTRNRGAREAQGELILFIDDDNIIDPHMITTLVAFADANPNYGIIGPAMYYLKNKKKYLDYQKINFFTGKTTGIIDNSNLQACDSHGVPNIFMIRKQVFTEAGFFDEELVQTYTEPDFAFHSAQFGYKCGIVKNAKTYHNVSFEDNRTPRSLGGMFKQKAYCLMRNRSVIIARYGKWYHKIIYFPVFSWIWPLIYSLLMLRFRRFDLIKLYLLGWKDGFGYLIKGKFIKKSPNFHSKD